VTQEQLRYPIPSEAALEPPAEWARLREQCPVMPVTLPSGDEAALVTRYADVRAVLSDPRFTRPVGQGARVADVESGGVFNSEMATVLPQEGEGHLRWRRMIGKWFTAKRMNALRPAIEAMAEQLVDEMVKQGAPADLKASVGFPLPVWVICDLLGVPDTDRDRFAHWSDMLLSMTRFTQEEMASSQAEFNAYMAGHIAAKRAAPGDDLLSALIGETDADGNPHRHRHRPAGRRARDHRQHDRQDGRDAARRPEPLGGAARRPLTGADRGRGGAADGRQRGLRHAAVLHRGRRDRRNCPAWRHDRRVQHGGGQPRRGRVRERGRDGPAAQS
jgi:hypothetical protein